MYIYIYIYASNWLVFHLIVVFPQAYMIFHEKTCKHTLTNKYTNAAFKSVAQ